MGTIILKLRVGIKRVLNEVKHVPVLKINPILLRELVRDGYLFKENGIYFKVTRGSMAFFIGETKNGIHILKGGMNMPIVDVGEMEYVTMMQL